MTEVSSVMTDSARKIESKILQALADHGQKAVAITLDLSESAVSRLKDGQISTAARLLAAVGLKVVPTGYREVDPARAEALGRVFELAMQRVGNPAQLLWEVADDQA